MLLSLIRKEDVHVKKRALKWTQVTDVVEKFSPHPHEVSLLYSNNVNQISLASVFSICDSILLNVFATETVQNGYKRELWKSIIAIIGRE